MKSLRVRALAVALLVSAFCLAAGAIAALSSRPPLTPAKQAILDHQFALPPGAAPPAPKKPAYVPPYDPPRPQIVLAHVTSIDVQAPLSPALFAPTTQWIGLVDGVQIAVYGGSAAHEGGAAAIYVWLSDLDAGRDLDGTGLFVAEDAPGPLTLTGISGHVATFTCPNRTGRFDLLSHEFAWGPP
jgi:hypothetical protein